MLFFGDELFAKLLLRLELRAKLLHRLPLGTRRASLRP